MGKVMAVNISEKRGTQKVNVHTVKLSRIMDWRMTPMQGTGTARSAFFPMRK